MNVTVRLLPTKKETRIVDLEDGATVENLIRELGLFPDAWIAVRDRSPIPLDELLRANDKIDLIAVVSGG